MITIPKTLPRLRRLLTTGVAALALLTSAQQAQAFNGILQDFEAEYPASNSANNASCQLCHGSSTSTWNEYGWGLRQNGQNFAALEGLPSINVNGGTTMLDEINASTQPGWTTGTNNNLYDSGGLVASNASPPGGIGTLDPPTGNQPPVADPNGPYTGTTGVSVAFDGTGSSDPEGGPLTYEWDFGDGVGTATGSNPTYTYVTAGVYNVSLTVTDDGGLTDTALTTANITDPGVNQPPTSDPNGPYIGTIGVSVAFDGTGSSDPEGGPLTYDWDFGDGVGTATGSNPTYTYTAAGTYTVILTVTDDQGAADVASTTATISDAPACTGLTIDEAEWDARKNRLEVEGDGGEKRGGDFVLTNAYDPAQILATGSRRNGQSFSFKVRNPDPVPCAVQVEQPLTGLCAIADVLDAPADCAPPGPVVPPEPLAANGDVYATPVGNPITVTASRVSGVLYNDMGGVPPLTASLVSGPTQGTLDAFGADGSFTYTPGATMTDNQTDTFTYQVTDDNGDTAEATVVIQTLSKQVDFKIFMNYELGMHCTGFEFAYCCVLPPYNSILAQVVKPAQGDPACAQDEDGCPDYLDGYPRLLEGDPNEGLDVLNRETVVRDWDHTTSQFKKYQLRYYHDAQPRQEGNTSKPNTSTLISAVEGNSLQYFNTVFDSAAPDPATNALVYGPYNGYQNVLQGDGAFTPNFPVDAGPGGTTTDNYANAWLNHFYIYVDPANPTPVGPNLEGHGNTGLEADKIRLGVAGQVAYPPNAGAALQPMGPEEGNPFFENVLTFSADTGTIVYTQAKVLEDLPIMLTSPRIWEALGLPLTPFEDDINFFADPGAVDEDAVRPYVAMKASLHEYPSGDQVYNTVSGEPVIGFGTAPIDIPNCERCHSAPSINPDTGMPNLNSPNWNRADEVNPYNGIGLEDITNLEYNFWLAYYDLVPGVDSDWYARLKGAAINMLTLHDADRGTGFTANYPGTECVDPLNCAGGPLTDESDIPQKTRLGHESVVCQRCHADNVIANVKSATFDAAGQFPIPPITEAIHNQHRNKSEGGVIVFNDSLGRDGGCQGCHPAHRSDGVMEDYPITLGGDNAQASTDNRLGLGGCFVGRDVHSNPLKDIDGAETDEHLTAVGQWLKDNVSRGQAGLGGSDADQRGIWCTNCHSQLSQEIWKTEDCNDLIRGDCLVNPRAEPTLADVAAAVGLTEQEAIDMLDPLTDPNDPTKPGPGRLTDQTHRIWDPGTPDANIATIEVGPGGPVVTFDADGDPSVNILSFCTTQDCVDRINNNKTDQTQWRYPANAFIDPVNNSGVAVPFNAATDGRDHWLSAGEPHCADCHAAPYTEQSGNISAYPPFNYPAKASLMRYTRGHQDVSCQGCHESIHGLYPVTPTIDTTSYAQAAALNNDGSHGPLKCATCHTHVDADGIPNWVAGLQYTDPTGADSGPVSGNYDRAVGWMHTYTDEANPIQDVCQNCHEDESGDIAVDEVEWLEHAMTNRTSRIAMDAAERAVNNGEVFGETAGGGPGGNQRQQLCTACHENRNVECTPEWNNHLIQGRVSQIVWEDESAPLGGCGW